MYAQRRDINEPEIVDALRCVGAYVQQMDKSVGFDLLVAFRGVLYVVEVKNCKPQNVYRELTENESKTMQLIEKTGVNYNIVTGAAAALAVVGINTGEQNG